jgi:hypothetical protein
MSHKGPSAWSLLTPPTPSLALGTGVITQIKEILRPDTNEKAVLVAQLGAPQLWVLYGGTQSGTLTAVAETWPLPDLKQLPVAVRDTIKVFHEMWVEGEDIPNWQYQISVDYGATYSDPRPLQMRNRIGINGRQIQVKFSHAAATTNVPMLSLVKITQSIRRQASGQSNY